MYFSEYNAKGKLHSFKLSRQKSELFNSFKSVVSFVHVLAYGEDRFREQILELGTFKWKIVSVFSLLSLTNVLERKPEHLILVFFFFFF